MTEVRAAVLRGTSQPLQIENVTLDEPHARELRVRIEAAGVCHTDLHYMSGDMNCPLPIVLGHEGAGIVEAVGPDGNGRVKVGDRVALMWRPRCGECEACVSGNPVLCEFGKVQATTGGLLDGTSRLSERHYSEGDGDAADNDTDRSGEPTVEKLHHFLGVSCFAEQVIISEKSVVVVPDGVPAEIAAIAGCAVITGIGAVMNVVTEAAGRSMLIFGAGGVGLSSVMGATLVGTNPIIVVDLDPAKLELAKALGATHTIDASAGDVVEQVLAIKPNGVDWAIEAVGRAETLQQSFSCLKAGGTTVAVGLGRVGATFAVPVNELVQRQKRVIGCLYGSANPLIDLPRIFELYLAGRLPLDTLLGESMPLDRVNEAYEQLVSGSVGRAVIIPAAA